MSRVVFFLAVVAVVAIYSLEVDARYYERPTPSPRCGPNAAWNNCGSACPPACNSKPGTMCIQVCVAGCFCKPGYLLNHYGKCVTREHCRDR